MNSTERAPALASPELERGLTLASATALNMIDMIGVGPFITLPLIVTAMGGPQAMLGWIFGAVLALCDGMVWAELGAAMPESGGSYEYLKQLYGPHRLGRALSFLFIWQLSFSAPLSIASGAIGFSEYAAFLFPTLGQSWFERKVQLTLPGLGPLSAHLAVGPAALLSIAVCWFAVLLLYRRITRVAWISRLLWLGVLAAIAWIISAGATHFHSRLAFAFPSGAFHLGTGFFTGLGAAMLIATYDYWGYYNVCFLGGEVREPERTIPRAIIISIVAVAVLYLAMNICVLGVLPWQQMQAATNAGTNFPAISIFMQQIYGFGAARLVTVLILWTAFASVFSLLLGYSRIPFAAARDGNYFRAFARVHPEKHIPSISLLFLGLAATLFCFFRLIEVVAALVVVRILLQFLLQSSGLLLWRARHPQAPRPFRMWLYPLPACLAILGFLYVLFARKNFLNEILLALLIAAIGILLYVFRAAAHREWPLARNSSSDA